MAARFEDRITAYVEQQLESAFDGKEGSQPKIPTKLALTGTAIGFAIIFMMIFVLVAVAFLIKTLFF